MPETDLRTDLSRVGARIDALLDACAGSGMGGAGGTVARERAEELVRLVADLYGAGLERVLEILHDAGRLDDQVLADLAGDELVSGLLVVHGLHPWSVEQRVEHALEQVRPYLGSHGGDVELLEVTDAGTVRLRLLGSCDGCPSSSVTLTLAVEQAIEAAAPEVESIEVEPPPSTASTAPTAATGPLIPVESLRSRLAEADRGSWVDAPDLVALAPGGVVDSVVAGTAVVGCRVGEDRFAFAGACPRCGAGLGAGTLARRLGGDRHDALLVCPGCQAHFDVRRAGACVDDPALHLDPLPLLADAGTVRVAVPVPEPRVGAAGPVAS